MDLRGLKCFVAVAEELHFGRAAQQLNMLPSALGRHVRLLEEEFDCKLFARTTRHVTLTREGEILLEKAGAMLRLADGIEHAMREAVQDLPPVLRIGAIDSAAAGLLPELLHEFHQLHPAVQTSLVEGKSVALLPLLASGRLDVGFVRPPGAREGLVFEPLVSERMVLALPRAHPLARKAAVELRHLQDLPLIVPPQRRRPHSFNLVIRLFASMGAKPRIVQEAEEKQTILTLVAAGVGAALVPDWAARMRVRGVVYKPLDLPELKAFPEATIGAAWVADRRCRPREDLLALARTRLRPAR